ncbi:MAG: D-glycero-beta-D-manno-heptose 1-phosphate adenylyltransferase, partial [Chitinophagales bacterium]|nr:D-glycero-beta-D-manno-heptose 1-phosphate adenylyltransferase [Chitinophagales bacterium]
KLIVAINSDSSVKKLKGENRPINNELHRATLIAALEVVNATVIFEEETPAALISEIKPNILVKGGDYTVSQIAGADFVLKNGGEVKIIPLEKNLSTTKILSSLNRK